MSAMSWNRLRRKVVSGAVVAFCAAAVVLALIPLGFILFFVIGHGLPALNAAFFTQMPKPVGEPGGGMANAMVGTLILLGLAAALAVPVGIVSGVFLSEYKGSRIGSAVRFAADVLNGVPSIVIGIFAYTVAVLPFQRFTALAGGLALGVMMLPLIVRTTEELLRLVPESFREGALALGATRSRAVWTVILPAALPGIVTGVLVALARVAGETAPLLFTAFNNRFWSPGWREPTASLPVMIFTYAVAPYDDWHRQAWAAGLVLLGLVLVVNIIARLVLARGISVPRA